MVSKGRIKRKLIKYSCCVDHMLILTIPSLYTFLIIFCSSLLLYCSATTDTITINSWISDNREETLVSAGKKFELGFFTPNSESSSNTKARYVGIWYYNFTPHIVVWVANRDRPLSDRNGSFAVKEDGNLMVLNGKGDSYWSTDLVSSPSSSKTAKLMDSGNLIFIGGVDESGKSSSSILWESFKNPTDTFLPGMKMTETLKLTSWNSTGNDPAIGAFTFQQDQDDKNQYIIQNRSIPYWKSGVFGKFISSDDMIPAILYILSNYTLQRSNFPVLKGTIPKFVSDTRVVMNSSGKIQCYVMKETNGWQMIWNQPRDKCSVFNACGNYGSCYRENDLIKCKCLPGFEQSYSGGCTRKSPLCGENNEKIKDFVSLKMMKLGKPDSDINPKNWRDCRDECAGNCECRAYSYDEAKNTTPQRGPGPATVTAPAKCWIWNRDLNNLQEEYPGGHDLYVRVALSDIESTRRNCKTCGTNIIPYPLSTEPSCGDPMYNGFYCNYSTGHVNFEVTGGGMYPVSIINPKTQNFFIKTGHVDNCEARNSKGEFRQLRLSSPFHVNSSCSIGSDMSKKGTDELEISWDPPPEPTCNSSTDCKDWPNSTCNERGEGMGKRCLCNHNFQWNSSSINCTQIVSEGSPTKPLEVPASSSKMSQSLIIAIAITSVIVLIAVSCAIVYISYLWKRRIAKLQENRENIQRNQALYGSERRVKDLIDSGEFREEDKLRIDVPFFNLESILVATDNFSDENKLGRGGFGPVYKGVLPGGREIAVKRLLSVSGQGLEEFKNEVILIAKLQHRNLVRLLGYCIEREEKILLYEYMPNKSLDSFIFDRTLCMELNWELRFNIILGIARGLLYLHQDSRLRIIHRDLKTSNILLDEEMNPKISDFGLARMFEGKQIEGSTNRVVGTYGYMSPEYALDGFFSVKSDVFSFGVVVLEIISGRRNTGFYQSKQTLSLLGDAWKLWNEDKALDLMDQTLHETCNTNEFLRCVNVGLLCVQEDANDRPIMSNVLFMLGNEAAMLPTPRQPAFIVRRDPSSTASSSTKPETLSYSELSSNVEGR